ncbi:GNAT family N-acetyltransferase [Patescibacteria group bacterium]|nr:GNAT family N-acetyltransferase [Patescibacteria group bacterium]
MKYKFEISPINQKDLDTVNTILSDWLSKEEVDHYVKSIENIISKSTSKPKFDSHYYVATFEGKVVGVAGFRKPNPKLLEFTTTKTPAELCILYVDKEHRGGKGVGTALLNHIIKQAKKRKYKEFIVRSAEKLSDTGWGFYDNMDFDRVGRLSPPEYEKVSQVWVKFLSTTSPNRS